MQKTKTEIIMDADEIAQTIDKLQKEIKTKYQKSLQNLQFIGILAGGYPLALRLSSLIEKETKVSIPVGKLDIALYRDDLSSRDKFVTIRETDIPFDITNKNIILVDDVLFNGRTIRSALNALMDFGRPSTIELAVLIDRGHREVPIYANYIGKTISTPPASHVNVKLLEIDGEDVVCQT
jgi:pyrimidine operon attenuation protein/uracil phosphoribosyltransferase